MADTGRHRWQYTVVLAGALYFAVGYASVVLAGAAGSAQATLYWRWAAFAISGVIFAFHIARELFRLRASAVQTAWRAAAGVAIGAFGLALAANLHELSSAAAFRPRMLTALVAWPLLTAVPAFLVALAGATALRRTERA
jgi:hypothetical protein